MYCEEILQCYEAYLKIELLTREWSKYEQSPCLQRFQGLSSSTKTSSDENQLVPLHLAPLHLLFFQSFVDRDAMFELNLPNVIKSKCNLDIMDITNVIEYDQSFDVKDVGINVSIFDHAMDDLLELLYQNAFKSFVDKYTL